MIAPGKMIREVVAHLLKKSATEQYPFVKPDMHEHFRGQIHFDPALCTGCRACMRDCPSDAIKIKKVGDKKFEATFELDRCLYCAQCTDSCKRKALKITQHYELAALNRSELTVTFHIEVEDGNEPQPLDAQPKGA